MFLKSLKGHLKNCAAISMGVNMGIAGGRDEMILPDHMDNDHGISLFSTFILVHFNSGLFLVVHDSLLSSMFRWY